MKEQRSLQRQNTITRKKLGQHPRRTSLIWLQVLSRHKQQGAQESLIAKTAPGSVWGLGTAPRQADVWPRTCCPSPPSSLLLHLPAAQEGSGAAYLVRLPGTTQTLLLQATDSQNVRGRGKTGLTRSWLKPSISEDAAECQYCRCIRCAE